MRYDPLQGCYVLESTGRLVGRCGGEVTIPPDPVCPLRFGVALRPAGDLTEAEQFEVGAFMAEAWLKWTHGPPTIATPGAGHGLRDV